MHLSLEPLVLRHIPPRRNGQLHQDAVRSPVWVHVEEAAEGHQLVRDALHVVQAVYAQDHLPTSVLHVQLLDLLSDLRQLQRLREVHRGDAYGNRGASDYATADRGGINAMCGNLQGGQLHASAKKVPEVVIHVETKQVCVEKAFNDLLSPGERPVDLGRREGRVQEPADVRVRLHISKHLRNEHQMIVVHPDVIVVLVDLQDRLHEELICLLIRFPLRSTALIHALVKGGHDVVKKWPQHVVGKTIVVVVDQVLREENRVAVDLHCLRSDHILVRVGELRAGPA
mmetsp:Transcript_110252/g.322685  ORF Transcript_110252/g.322685 Transcript_110252/m.322685 type:complete len:285 (-) Transcript_110252:425-1279(-)